MSVALRYVSNRVPSLLLALRYHRCLTVYLERALATFKGLHYDILQSLYVIYLSTRTAQGQLGGSLLSWRGRVGKAAHRILNHAVRLKNPCTACEQVLTTKPVIALHWVMFY